MLRDASQEIRVFQGCNVCNERESSYLDAFTAAAIACVRNLPFLTDTLINENLQSYYK